MMKTNQPLLLSGPDALKKMRDEMWGSIRGNPQGEFADRLLAKGIVDEAANKADLEPYVWWRRFKKELGYLRPIPEVPKFKEFLKKDGRYLPNWSEEKLAEEYRIQRDRIVGFREGREEEDEFGEFDRWEEWLWNEFDPCYDFWRTRTRHVRRAWLCLAILGKPDLQLQRDGGYTRKDIQRLARVDGRGAARNVLDKLTQCGALKRTKRATKQPRYSYTARLNTRAFERGMNEWHLRGIKRLTDQIKNALREGTKTGKRWEPFPPDVYMVGGPAPPIWVLKALSATLMIAREILKTSLDLPPGRDVKPHLWEPEELWSRIGKNAKPELRRLCLIAEDVRRDEWKKWIDSLFKSDTQPQPIVLAYLVDLVATPIPIPDEPMPVEEYEFDWKEIEEREFGAKKKKEE